VIKKLGTIDCDMVETTPIVFKDRLCRFEYVRQDYHTNKTGASHFRFVDMESGEFTPAFAAGHHFGSAYVRDRAAFAYGVDTQGGPTIRAFWSEDLRNWSSQVAFHAPGWSIFNNSVCKGRDNYIMAIELNGPPEEVGVPFTIRFVQSDDLLSWQLTPSECVFSKDRYTACPALRFLDEYYYMIYLEARLGRTFDPYIVRSRDLIHWESSPFNPMMHFSEEDKRIANPNLTQEQRDRISNAVNINNSDVDLCEFEGRTIIFYSWGNQKGIEFLAEAAYDGNLESFLCGFFP
jgi:alpha-L-fucosidase